MYLEAMEMKRKYQSFNEIVLTVSYKSNYLHVIQNENRIKTL